MSLVLKKYHILTCHVDMFQCVVQDVDGMIAVISFNSVLVFSRKNKLQYMFGKHNNESRQLQVNYSIHASVTSFTTALGFNVRVLLMKICCEF